MLLLFLLLLLLYWWSLDSAYVVVLTWELSCGCRWDGMGV